MTAIERFDAVVIGSGQAGGPLARDLAEAGSKTALIERKHLGGTCVNEGCTPTKTMVASARVAYLARRGADYGVAAGSVRVGMTKVRERKRDIVESFGGVAPDRAEALPNREIIFGEARFVGARTLEVRLERGGVRRLSAERVFVNAGARPSTPRLEGGETEPLLDSTSIMELDAVPSHLIVLGGGYIGLEFGQMFRRFGSEVTIVQRGKALLAREDADVAEAVLEILREDEIEVLLESEARRVERASGGALRLTIEGPAGRRAIEGSHVLAAAGRTPNSDRLDLAAGGIAADARGFIRVNARLETNVPGVWALGDINGGPAFTHVSYDDYRIIRTNLLEGGDATTEGRLVPYTVFIDPQLGRVGLSEQDARARGRKIRVARMGMDSVARALELDESRGLMKVIVDAESGAILGAAVLGIEGGELMSILQMAMLGKLPFTTLQNAIFAHPTLAESLNNVFNYFDE